MTTTITVGAGAAIASITGTGNSVDTFNIPPGATITITPQRGFGDVQAIATDQNADDAATGVKNTLYAYGAE